MAPTGIPRCSAWSRPGKPVASGRAECDLWDQEHRHCAARSGCVPSRGSWPVPKGALGTRRGCMQQHVAAAYSANGVLPAARSDTAAHCRTLAHRCCLSWERVRYTHPVAGREEASSLSAIACLALLICAHVHLVKVYIAHELVCTRRAAHPTAVVTRNGYEECDCMLMHMWGHYATCRSQEMCELTTHILPFEKGIGDVPLPQQRTNILDYHTHARPCKLTWLMQPCKAQWKGRANWKKILQRAPTPVATLQRSHTQARCSQKPR